MTRHVRMRVNRNQVEKLSNFLLNRGVGIKQEEHDKFLKIEVLHLLGCEKEVKCTKTQEQFVFDVIWPELSKYPLDDLLRNLLAWWLIETIRDLSVVLAVTLRGSVLESLD